MNVDVNIIGEMIVEILPFIKNTLVLTFFTFLLALLLAIILAVIIDNKVLVLSQIGQVYSSFFRCTPLVAQLFFFYFGVAEVIPFLDGISAANAMILTFGMNESAFMAETLRGALSSIDKGQSEAALSLGMNQIQAMRRIILPQAIRVAIPGLSNSFVGIVKGTSIGFTIGVMEMMSQAKLLAARSYRMMEAYIAVLILYWILIFLLTRVQVLIEKRLNRAY